MYVFVNVSTLHSRCPSWRTSLVQKRVGNPHRPIYLFMLWEINEDNIEQANFLLDYYLVLPITASRYRYRSVCLFHIFMSQLANGLYDNTVQALTTVPVAFFFVHQHALYPESFVINCIHLSNKILLINPWPKNSNPRHSLLYLTIWFSCVCIYIYMHTYTHLFILTSCF